MNPLAGKYLFIYKTAQKCHDAQMGGLYLHIFFLSVLLRHVFLKVARGFARIVTVITAVGLFSGVIAITERKIRQI